jgi:hypothetical protein
VIRHSIGSGDCRGSRFLISQCLSIEFVLIKGTKAFFFIFKSSTAELSFRAQVSECH